MESRPLSRSFLHVKGTPSQRRCLQKRQPSTVASMQWLLRLCWIARHCSFSYSHLLLYSLSFPFVLAGNMSSYTPEPSLSGVLIVLNIILALIWVPVLDAVDDTTYLFHAIFFVNAFTAGWWIWMNTSLRRRIRQLSRHALACLQFLQTLATTIFAALARLFSALDFTAYLRRPMKECADSVAPNERQAYALRLAWLISACYEQSRDARVHPHSLSEDARKRRGILQSYVDIVIRRTAATSGDSSQAATAISPDPSDYIELNEEGEIPVDAMTIGTDDDDLAALDSVSCSYSWTHLDPKLAMDDIVYPPQPSVSSAELSTYSTPQHLVATTQEVVPSTASPSDTQQAEYAQLHRDLCTVTKERDVYRARAYELALRLDDCYTAHSQTSCALEGAERELMEVQSAITELEEERRALSVALGVVTAAFRKGTASQLPTSSNPATGDLAQNVASASEEEVVYPRASTTEVVVDAATGPLLLPPSEDSEVESATPRMRTTTWTTSSVVTRPKSKLETIIHEAQQRARHARSKTAGQGAVWDAQRAASARPIFSVIHEEIKAENAFGRGVAASPRLTGLTEAEQIIEDLRASRMLLNPPESPALGCQSTVEEPQACVPVSLELEAVPEVEEIEVAVEVEEVDAPTPETPELQVVLEAKDDVPPVGMVDTQSMQDIDLEQVQEAMVAINVPISRHPRGPPPSPFGKAVERELEAAAIYTRGKEQTWRGRPKPSEALDAPTLLANMKADPFQPYPESRLPNRVRARQATAPSPTTSHPLTMPPTVPIRVNISPSNSITLVGDQHKRHATFCGDSPAPVVPSAAPKHVSVGSPRWPSSVLGNGGIERLRSSLQAYPFVPNSAFYQTAGKV
ncbi:hypothetical protein FKP32DRAFT_1686593 [Trametes sanguinea]|nr:hypothetical protein FKP32DRAFT_1686593 [Trametes sanguinea]